jgi:hypothetical protein
MVENLDEAAFSGDEFENTLAKIEKELVRI